jgi:TATA-box binding protein (TBP) (component of TFIID and TFIIIB)
MIYTRNDVDAYKEELELMSEDFISDIQISVITLLGRFSNLNINAKNVYYYYLTNEILAVESNYGRLVSDGYNPNPKNKKDKCKRKPQGNGSKFNSMIQFHVKSMVNDKNVYKIKIFQKGSFGIPGVKRKDLSDAIPSLMIVTRQLQEIHHNKSINIIDVYPILVNYKCRIRQTSYKIILKNAIYALEQLKYDDTDRKYINSILLHSCIIEEFMIEKIMIYIPINRYHIAEIKYEPERMPSGFNVKFSRPNSRLKKSEDKDAKSTVKIFKSGKLNLDAVKTTEEAHDLYEFLTGFFQTKNVLFDPKNPYVSYSDDSSDEFDD